MLVLGSLLAGMVFNLKDFLVYSRSLQSKIFWELQFFCRPVFSSEFINTDKNKMERFLHAGRFSVASIYAPISFPPLPSIILKISGENAAPVVAAVGSLKTVDPDRIILKRVILTGYGYMLSGPTLWKPCMLPVLILLFFLHLCIFYSC